MSSFFNMNVVSSVLFTLIKLLLIYMSVFNLNVCVRRYLYWSDWGDVPHIGRIGMDGTDRSIIIKDKITWPNGLTLDFINDRIYWADAREDYIAFASLDGSNRHIGTESRFLYFLFFSLSVDRGIQLSLSVHLCLFIFCFSFSIPLSPFIFTLSVFLLHLFSMSIYFLSIFPSLSVCI